jgi:hypothetical protein
MRKQKFFKFNVAFLTIGFHRCAKMRKEPMLKIIIFTQALQFDSLVTRRLDFKVSLIAYVLSE